MVNLAVVGTGAWGVTLALQAVGGGGGAAGRGRTPAGARRYPHRKRPPPGY